MCLVRAESSTRQLTSVPAPLLIWLSPPRPLIVSHGDEATVLLAAGSRLVRRLEDSGDVEPAEVAIAYSLAELAPDMCPSEPTHGLLHRLAIHLDTAALGCPSFHPAFECRILVRDSEQSLSLDRAAEDLTALVLLVFSTIILAHLDEDPEAVLVDGRTITSSSAYLFPDALDADSTGVELIAVLYSIAATPVVTTTSHEGRPREREKTVATTKAWMTQAPPPPPPPSLSHHPPHLPPHLPPYAPSVTVAVVLIFASVKSPSRRAVRWTVTVASTSTDDHPHDSRVAEQGDAATTHRQANVD